LFVVSTDYGSNRVVYFFRERAVVFFVVARFVVDLAAEVARFLGDFLAVLRVVIFFLAVPVFALVDFLAVDFLAVPVFALVDFLAIGFLAVFRFVVAFLAVPAFALVDFVAFFVVRDFVALLFVVFAVAISFGSCGYRHGYPLNPGRVAPAPSVEQQPVSDSVQDSAWVNQKMSKKLFPIPVARFIVSFGNVVKQKPLPAKRLSCFVLP
jgi:hypothetical protein